MKVFQEEVVRIMADQSYQVLTSMQQVSVVQELTSWFHNWFHQSDSKSLLCEAEKDEYELTNLDSLSEDVETNLSREQVSALPWFTLPR